MRKLYIILLLAVTPFVWASVTPQDEVISNEHRAWINGEYNRIKGQEFDVWVNNLGEILHTSQKLTVKNCEDYIQLIASNLVKGNLKNKEMLLEGFILFAIIQGDVFPVDYSNLAIGGNQKELLLKNAAKIAAYAMTYRKGAGEGGVDDDGAIRETAHIWPAKGNRVFYRSLQMLDGSDKPEYEYLQYKKQKKTYASDSDSETDEIVRLTDNSLNRQGAITKLRGSQRFPTQAHALTDAFHIHHGFRPCTHSP